MKFRITHVADCQVKDRNKPLYIPTMYNLMSIEQYVRDSKANIHVIAGDLFEFCVPNETERKLIYEHILRLLQIETLEELVIIAGNHDIVKEKKKDLMYQNDIQPNAISIFTDVLNSGLNTDKLRYFAQSGIYDSYVSNRINYVVYSREDTSYWKELKNKTNPDKINICLYHAMIQEYVDYDKIPLSPASKTKLDTLELFPDNSIILAGDIHKTLIFEDKDNHKKFIYPGSTLQQTYKEGAYLPGDSDPKYVMCYDVDDSIYHTIDDIQISNEPLENQVCYNTITLDNKLNTENNFELFREKIRSIEYGVYQTYLKIKTNNALIGIEKQIREYVEKYVSNGIYLEFDYDKFVQPDTFIDNTVVNDIYESKRKEILESTGEKTEDLIISSKNIDNLLLNKEQLVELFDNILQKQIDNLTVDDISTLDVRQHVIDLFSNELNNVLDNATKRYDIQFVRIKTNNFMYIGESEIDLDLPNITRIIGTNGIGKTTLYRMIRWCITGEIFAGMQSNRVVQNNLLLFNTNKPNIDDVCVELDMVINGNPIKVKRTVHRDWKQTATNENKTSIDWKDFVTNLERNFYLILTPTTGELKIYQGEQAEKQLKSWFGNTIDTILFLNQAKIYSLLNTKPTELNELILNYIGVDYLKALENNLDLVKDNLMRVGKPKRKGEEINADKKIYQKQVEQLNSDKEQNQKYIDSAKQTIQKQQEEIDSLNEQLVSVGNVPLLIEDCKQEINFIQNTIDTEFSNISDKLVPREFDKIKPIKPDFQQLDDEEESVKGAKILLSDNIKELESIKPKLLDSVQNIIDSITEENNKLNEERKQLENDISNRYTSISNVLREIETAENNKLLEVKFNLEIKGNKQEQIADKIKELKTQIESGICPTCGKPFQNDFADFKVKTEIKIKKLQEADILLETELKSIKESKNEYEKNIEQIQKAIKSCTNKYNDVETFKLFQTILHTVGLDNKILESLDIDVLSDLIEKLSSIKIDTDYDLNMRIGNKLLTFEVPETVTDKFKLVIKQISAYNKKSESYKTKQQDFDDKLATLSKQRNDILSAYNKAQEEFIQAKEEYDKYLESCDAFNKEIDRLNNERKELENKLEQKKQEQEILEEEKLDIYNSLQRDLIDSKNNLKFIQEEIEKLNKQDSIVSSEITRKQMLINQCEQEYEAYIEYMMNNAVWKIYSKLIKTTFKEIVFDYYRNYLNNTLNYLLSDVSFKLYWNQNSELTMVQVRNGVVTYQSVKQSSGMETTFLGLALIYTIHMLNVKNSISHIFIDEISGTLNKGQELSYSAENYQELFVKILSKFTDKSVWIVDHAVEDLHESNTYEVVPSDNCSVYKLVKE